MALEESHGPYAEAASQAFGEGNAFFLDRHGAWKRFVDRVAELLEPVQCLKTGGV